MLDNERKLDADCTRDHLITEFQAWCQEIWRWPAEIGAQRRVDGRYVTVTGEV